MKKSFFLISAIIIIFTIIYSFIYIDHQNVERENVSENKNEEENLIIYEMKDEEIRNLNTTIIEDKTVEEENEIEEEGFERQGNIEYNGSDEKPTVQLGNYKGLTYYSQIDSRWNNHLYTSTGNSSQTIGSSGCGPTVAAMIVTSAKGTITPLEMGDLFVKYGHRSANNGTYWSAFPWIADVFDIGYMETAKLDKVIELIKEGNFAIASCGNGLFTYNGHYIVIIGIEGNNLKIYDPYLYKGKFDTSTRRGKVNVDGNIVYCSIENFSKYANFRNFFVYKIDNNNQEDILKENTNFKQYKVSITAKTGLRIRSGPSTNNRRLGAYSYGYVTTILEEFNGWGRTKDGWIYLEYTKEYSNTSYTAGVYKVNTNRLNVRTGPGTNYKIKSLSKLTSSARRQGGYIKGVVCTVYEVKENWGRTPSGWICLNYCIKIR